MTRDLDELRESAPELEELLEAALDAAFGGRPNADEYLDFDIRR